VSDVVLAHYGKKGMHWGVRRASKYSDGPKGTNNPVVTKERPGHKVTAKGGENQPASADAKAIAISRQKAKKSSTDSLSTKDLQDLVNRMNLEQQYSRLTPDSRSTKGKKFAGKFVGQIAKEQLPKLAVIGLKKATAGIDDPRVNTAMKVAEAMASAGGNMAGKKKNK